MCTARFPTISHGIPGPMSKGEGYPPLLDIPIPLDIPTPLWTCPSPGHTLPAGNTYPLDIRTHPQKGPGTRDTHPWRGHGIRDTPPPWTDRHLERHYLPAVLFAGSNMEVFQSNVNHSSFRQYGLHHNEQVWTCPGGGSLYSEGQVEWVWTCPGAGLGPYTGIWGRGRPGPAQGPSLADRQTRLKT